VLMFARSATSLPYVPSRKETELIKNKNSLEYIESMCITRRKPVTKIDFFRQGEPDPPHRHPGVSVDTARPAVPRYRTRRVPEHPLERERFRRTRFVYQPANGLPDMGWIQNCLFCESPTTMIYAVDTHMGYCCGRCQKAFSDKDKDHIIRTARTQRY